MTQGRHTLSQNTLTQNAQNSDLKAIAYCHRQAFKASLSSAMGEIYLQKMLGWYLSTNKSFLYFIKEGQHCAGYCGGMIIDGTLPTGSASSMTQYSFKEAVISFLSRPWLIFHSEMRKKYPFVWRNIKIKMGMQNHQRPLAMTKQLEQEPHAGLVVIGVNPVFQGKGYGSILLKEFERKVVEEYGIHKLQLTVRSDNSKAIQAYERNGWIREAESGGSVLMFKVVQ